MVSQGQLKTDLKKIGCKLKSQLDGNWCIYEPRGKRVIVASLEEAHEYYLSKTKGTTDSPNNVSRPDAKVLQQKPLPTQVKQVPEEVKQAIAPTQVQPVPEEVKQAIAPTQVQPVPEELKQTEMVTQVKPVPEQVQRAAVPTQVKPVPEAVKQTQKPADSSISKSQLKVDLKKMGCKLKSQLDGSWAIYEPKGNRVVVESLEKVQQYYLAKKGGGAAISQAQPDSQRSEDADKTVIMPAQPSPIKITRSNKKITRSSAALKNSAELGVAIEKANHVINLIKEKRLRMGINVTHSDLRNNLLAKVCTDDLLDDVMRYVETRLDKECLDRVLVKRRFKNYLGEDDVMYFDIRYAGLLAKPE